MACNCCVSCLAFHRLERGWSRQVLRSTWKDSKKTAGGKGGLWMPTQQVRGGSKNTSQLPFPNPHLPCAGAVAFLLTLATGPHPGGSPWRWKRGTEESQVMSSQ